MQIANCGFKPARLVNVGRFTEQSYDGWKVSSRLESGKQTPGSLEAIHVRSSACVVIRGRNLRDRARSIVRRHAHTPIIVRRGVGCCQLPALLQVMVISESSESIEPRAVYSVSLAVLCSVSFFLFLLLTKVNHYQNGSCWFVPTLTGTGKGTSPSVRGTLVL